LVGANFAAAGAVAKSQPDLTACGGFYSIGHMTNRPLTVDYAVGQGANAIEADLRFARGGDFTEFKHGFPCSCTGSNVGLCAKASCGDASAVGEMLDHLAKVQLGVALVVIDAKAGDIRPNALGYAGNKVAHGVIRELYGKGYNGSVVLSVSTFDYLPFLRSALEGIQSAAPDLLSRVRFSIDQEGEDAGGVIDRLAAIGAPIAYGTGRTGAGRGYRDAIRLAKARGVGFTYIWTIDDPEIMENYINEGVSAIMTDHPFRARDVSGRRNLRLAARGDAIECPAASAPRDLRIVH
jgi:hypothetical protein